MELKQDMNLGKALIKGQTSSEKRFITSLQHHSQIQGMADNKLHHKCNRGLSTTILPLQG
jgi:hypothetical protein